MEGQHAAGEPHSAPYEGFRGYKWSTGDWLAGRVGGVESVCWEANGCVAALCISALCALIWPVPEVACFKIYLTEAAVIVWLKWYQPCWRDILSNVVLYRAQALCSQKTSGWVNIWKFSSYLTENRFRLHYKNQVRINIFLVFFLLGDSRAFNFMCRRFGTVCQFHLYRWCKITPTLKVLTHWGRGHLNCLNARSRGF